MRLIRLFIKANVISYRIFILIFLEEKRDKGLLYTKHNALLNLKRKSGQHKDSSIVVFA